MDFKSLISKIESIDGPIETPKAPAKAEPIRLDEDTELRVLAGVMPLTESVIAEKKLTAAEKGKKEEVVKSMKKDKEGFEKRYGKRGEEVMHATATKIAKKTAESVEEGQEDLKKVGDKVKTSKGVMTKTATGLKHERSYEKEKDEDDDAPKAKKAKKESIDPEAFKAKFTKMVEAKKEEKKMSKKDKKMDEGSKPDFLDLDKDGNKKEPMKKAAADKGDDKKNGKKGMSAAQEKYFGKKKTVKESIEQKLTFKDMIKLVQESGGQQQIDPVDKALFTWAERVAKAKLGEGMKAEIYAGLIYERNGGSFEMYDVLAEDQK